jgi:hypothetical protein
VPRQSIGHDSGILDDMVKGIYRDAAAHGKRDGIGGTGINFQQRAVKTWFFIVNLQRLR